MRLPPFVGLPTDSTLQGHHRFAMVGGMYVRALVDAAVVTPVLLPSLQPPLPAAGGLAQWHGGRSAVVNPVGRVTHNPFYHAVLHAFGQACRQRQRFQQDSA